MCRCSSTADPPGHRRAEALALGATATLVGRPTVWGLAVGGEQGVVDVLEILRNEFDNALALTGCRSVADISSELLSCAVASVGRSFA